MLCVAKARICHMTDNCGAHFNELSRLCASYQICTFNVSCHDWTHDNITEFKWKLAQRPSSSSNETDSNYNHITGYATSQYVLIEASYL
ncbi:unnamed protein product [Rotaria sp. Silwood1]|nr:unnamed protein product [Rotaria sp. Silwood1]